MPHTFTFTVTNSLLSPLYTETLLLGYLGLSELDCFFARRHFYVVFTMRDSFNNSIPYTDHFAYHSSIRAHLTHGIIYDPENCRRYSPDYLDKIECPFEAAHIGDDQILTVYQANTLELFSGFPATMSVKAFRQEAFKIDGSNAIVKATERDIDEERGGA